MIARFTVKMILPFACAWARKQERFIIRTGTPLSISQLVDAARIGIKHPERIRLRVVEEVPLPSSPRLRKLAHKAGLLKPGTIGLTLRYGIFLRAGYVNDRRLIVHELAHTAQYERLGGIRPFLERYLYECLTAGYPLGLLEQEASEIAQRLCA